MQPHLKMQLNDLQELVCRLKENRDMQVETTTLGRYLGTESTRVALVLGKEILNRPVIVSTREETTQILDLKSGFVISFASLDEVMPKLISTFSNDKSERATMVSTVEKREEVSKEVIEREVELSSGLSGLCECKEVMYQPGSIEDRMKLVEKSIKILEDHKTCCCEEEQCRVAKAQGKLRKLMTYARSNSLAPGQVPSVYEIAIWEWVK